MNFDFWKSKKFLAVIVILILVIGGFFYWQRNEIKSFLRKRELGKMVALAEDYSIVESSTGEFIVDQRDGLKVRVPAGWKTEIGMDMFGLISDRHVTLYSEDFSYRPPKGCLVEMQISRLQERRSKHYDGESTIYPYEGVKEVKEIIRSCKEAGAEEKEGMKIISVDQYEALQKISILESGKHITIKVPTENRVYVFEVVLFSERCNKKLSQFLKTVSIK